MAWFCEHNLPRPLRPTLEQLHEVLNSNVVKSRDGRRHDSMKPWTLATFLQFCYPYISPVTFLLMHAYVFFLTAGAFLSQSCHLSQSSRSLSSHSRLPLVDVSLALCIGTIDSGFTLAALADESRTQLSVQPPSQPFYRWMPALLVINLMHTNCICDWVILSNDYVSESLLLA